MEDVVMVIVWAGGGTTGLVGGGRTGVMVGVTVALRVEVALLYGMLVA
jgi:hypothetical protein